MKKYTSIGNMRLLDIRVIGNDNNVIYEGAVETAPTEIKNLQYDKVQVGTLVNLYVYD